MRSGEESKRVTLELLLLLAVVIYSLLLMVTKLRFGVWVIE
jgi:hypothetical protein